MQPILLAWSQYPEPHGTSYHEADLVRMDCVIELLDRAEIFRASVTPHGWRWMWEHYGLDGLLALNRRGLWFDVKDEDLAIEQIVRRSVIAGYDPIAEGTFNPLGASALQARSGRPKGFSN